MGKGKRCLPALLFLLLLPPTAVVGFIPSSLPLWGAVVDAGADSCLAARQLSFRSGSCCGAARDADFEQEPRETSDDSSPSSRGSKPQKPKKPKKARVDELLVARQVVEDVKAAKALVMAGDVFIRGDQRVDSAALKVPDDSPLRVRTKRDHPWVSRGGLKLQHVLQQDEEEQAAAATAADGGAGGSGGHPWAPELRAIVKGATAIDVGSSTGGFTDVLLAHGAARVFAVDVGRGILDWRLRNDPRVLVRERLNARELTADHLRLTSDERAAERTAAAAAEDEDEDEEEEETAAVVTVLVCDCSFIRLSTVLPAAMALCAEGAALVALVKPQFEARAEEVEPGGVVRDEAVHRRICDQATEWLASVVHEDDVGFEGGRGGEGGGTGAEGEAEDLAASGTGGQGTAKRRPRRFGWRVEGVERSPVLGPAGNVEFLLRGTKVAVDA